MTVWFKLKSCVGKCWFFCLALRSSLCIPICILAALDRGKLDLVALLDKICVGDWTGLIKGYFCISSSIYVGLVPLLLLCEISSLLFWCISLPDHLTADSGASLWCGLLDILWSDLWRFHWCSKVHCQILLYLAIHIRQRSPWSDQQCAVLSLILTCKQ